MQKSGKFVIYRLTADKRTKEFLKQIMYRTSPADVDKGTTELRQAVVLGKGDAFKRAVGEGPEWAVGELVSTKDGVKVEE